MATASQHTDNLQSSPISTSTKSIDLEAVNTSRQGQRRSRQDTKQKLRTQLFRADPDSPVRELSEDDNSRRNSFGSLVNGVKRLSRSGSLVSQNPSARGSATQLVSSIVGSRLSLVPEANNADLDETERVHQEIKDQAEMDEQAAILSKRFSSIPEDDSVEATLSPIRRRSLFMPGIATRGSDILRKPPPPEHLLTQSARDYYFNPHHSESSPLARLAALDLAEDGRRSPVVRTETPCDLDYNQLGYLKLGTLRIMNGTASPVPSERSPRLRSGRSTPDLRRDDDYYTASEGHSSEDEATGDAHRQDARSLGISYPNVEEVYVSPRTTWNVTEKPPPGRVRTGSPLRFERAMHSPVDEFVAGRISPERNTRPLSFVECPVLSPDGATSIAQEYISEITHVSSNETSSIAQEYISELPVSPFSFEDSTPDDRPQVTSKATEYDDMLFDDEAMVVSPREEIPDPCDFDAPQMSSASRKDFRADSISDGSQEGDTTSTTTPSHGRHMGKPLSKTDSGYSSSASLGSVTNVQVLKPSQPDAPEAVFPVFEKEPYLPDIREDSSLHRTSLAQPRPTLPACQSILMKPKPKPRPVAPVMNSHRPSTESVQTVISTSSTRSATSGPKKLQKPRPLSQPIPAKYITVQGYRELAQAHIPPVPSEIAAKHAERLSNFPLLEHTYPSLNHTRSNETMSTGSIPPYVPIRFPSPACSMESSSASGGARPLTAPRPPPHRDYSSMEPSLAERRSSLQRVPGQIDFVTGISDFGTVNESLGASPYDIARSSLPPIPSRLSGARPTHPHQIGLGTTRVKTFAGMDAQEAAELARLRSKTLAERQQLPFALKQKLFDDRGGIPGKQPRPKSVMGDMPPLPSLSGPRDQFPENCQTSEQYRALPQTPSSRASPLPAKLRKAPPTQQQETQLPKISHAAAIEFHKSWEPHRQAWRQRRKSAGEGLFTRRSVSSEQAPPPPPPQSISGTATVVVSHRASMVNIPAPPLHTIPLSPSPRPENGFGRYDGGLTFGYEPGYGVGGSAGTRSLQSGASRKGVDMSMGYGVDLSDVPIIAGIKRW
jgi:hypothetical protein